MGWIASLILILIPTVILVTVNEFDKAATTNIISDMHNELINMDRILQEEREERDEKEKKKEEKERGYVEEVGGDDGTDDEDWIERRQRRNQADDDVSKINFKKNNKLYN